MVDTHLLNKDNIVNLDTFLDDNYLSSKQITNCITKIPQNVILELNNGSLTLKAGSKVYMPDGFESDGTTPKFDVVTVENDVIQTNGFNAQHHMMYQPSKNKFAHFIQGYNLFSGDTDPTDVPSTSCNYNTTLNKIRITINGGSSWSNVDYSLPIAITTSNSSQYTSIDQIFNGFGYIGNTVFILPEVEGIAPNGRNEDGTLKNSYKKTSIVTTRTLSGTHDYAITLNDNNNWPYYGYVSSETQPSGNYKLWYVPSKNIQYTTGTGTPTVSGGAHCIDVTTVKGTITLFKPKLPLHCVDYNDFDVVEGRLSSVENNYVTTDLSNSPYTTNRILEIPQDIKLELNNGTLTLKAGSKVYDGTGYSWIIQADASRTLTSNGSYTIVVQKDSNTTHIYGLTETHSQNTQPTSRGVWINTDTGATKWSNDGTTWSDCSLLLGNFTVSNGAISFIDQVFNGFGYIGSTMFMLPGIKVEYTIGRNPDGTYIKQMFTSTSVMTNTISGNYYAYFDVGFDVAAATNQIGYFGAYTNCMYTSLNPIIPSTGNVIWYNPMTGQAKLVNSDGTISSGICGSFRPCRCHVSAGKIDWWTNNNSIVNTVNSYSRPELAGMGMPSSNYINLTLGATGATYVAPANGWFHATGTTSDALNQLNFYNGTLSTSTTAPSGYGSRLILPVNKGDFVKFTYSSISPTLHFFFMRKEMFKFILTKQNIYDSLFS